MVDKQLVDYDLDEWCMVALDVAHVLARCANVSCLTHDEVRERVRECYGETFSSIPGGCEVSSPRRHKVLAITAIISGMITEDTMFCDTKDYVYCATRRESYEWIPHAHRLGCLDCPFGQRVDETSEDEEPYHSEFEYCGYFSGCVSDDSF